MKDETALGARDRAVGARRGMRIGARRLHAVLESGHAREELALMHRLVYGGRFPQRTEGTPQPSTDEGSTNHILRDGGSNAADISS